MILGFDSKNVIILHFILIWDLFFCAFFGLGELFVCHLELWFFVSGPYLNTHVSSPRDHFTQEIRLAKKSTRSWQMKIRFCFRSSDRIFGASFALIFQIFISSVTILWTVDFGSLTSEAMSLTFKYRSLLRTTFTCTVICPWRSTMPRTSYRGWEATGEGQNLYLPSTSSHPSTTRPLCGP